jgi:DNA-binding winged helix-turn-helix (wHTH) protein
MKTPNNSVIRVGDWRADAAFDEISKDGKTVKLEPTTMRLLFCLADRAGQVVSVEQLLNEVWKKRSRRSTRRARALTSRCFLLAAKTLLGRWHGSTVLTGSTIPGWSTRNGTPP